MNEGYTSLVAQIPTGTGENKIQIDPHPEGATAMGPEALTVSPNGTIYVLDSLQSQIVVVNGDDLSTISIDYAIYPRDILYTADALYVLDSNASIFEVDFQGNRLATFSLPENMGSLMVQRLIYENGQLGFITIENETYLVDTSVSLLDVTEDSELVTAYTSSDTATISENIDCSSEIVGFS